MVTGDQMLSQMLAAKADLDEAEERRADYMAQGMARYAHLHPATAEARTRSIEAVQKVERDWSLAHTRVQTYGIAATALYAREARDAARRARSDVDDDDLRGCKPATRTPSTGYAVGAGPGRRAS